MMLAHPWPLPPREEEGVVRSQSAHFHYSLLFHHYYYSQKYQGVHVHEQEEEHAEGWEEQGVTFPIPAKNLNCLGIAGDRECLGAASHGQERGMQREGYAGG